MSMEIKQATRGGVKPLVGFYGKSGSGKTFSALLFSRGLVGAGGKVVLVDSENGRGSIFADLIPGGYSVLDLDPPFTPDRYGEALDAAEKIADVIVVDSFSHEWSGDGGVLDMQEDELTRMAGDNWGKREACKMASWIKPKLSHKKLVQRLLRSKCAVVVCLRGEEKTHMQKGDDGKNKVITDQFSSPLADPRFIFELLVNFETVARDGVGGYVVPRKITHPGIRALLPGPDDQIALKHGEALGKWCSASGSAPVQPNVITSEGLVQPTPPAIRAPISNLKTLKAELWKATKHLHKGSVPMLQQWMWDEDIMGLTETLETLTEERLAAVLVKAKGKL